MRAAGVLTPAPPAPVVPVIPRLRVLRVVRVFPERPILLVVGFVAILREALILRIGWIASNVPYLRVVRVVASPGHPHRLCGWCGLSD